MYSLALTPARPSARTVRSAVAKSAPSLAPPPRLRDLRDRVAVAAQLAHAQLHHEHAVLEPVHAQRLEGVAAVALDLEPSRADRCPRLQRSLDRLAPDRRDRLPVAAPLEHDLLDVEVVLRVIPGDRDVGAVGPVVEIGLLRRRVFLVVERGREVLEPDVAVELRVDPPPHRLGPAG